MSLHISAKIFAITIAESPDYCVALFV